MRSAAVREEIVGSIRNICQGYITIAWLAACACLLFSACSGHGAGLVSAEPAGETAAAATVELAALDSPEGVDPGVWEDIREAFATLEVRSTSVSAPLNEANRIESLTCLSDDGTWQITWQYRNVGDYNQDGTVGVSDLTPVGVHYGKTSSSPDWETARLADGNGDGLIGLSDITPLGQNYGHRVDGYYLEVSTDPEPGGWELVVDLPFSAAVAVEGQAVLRFYVDLPDNPIEQSFRATPYCNRDATGNPESGVEGAAVVVSENQRGDWWMEFSDRRHSCFSNHTGPVTNHIWWSLDLGGAYSSQPVYNAQGTILVGGANGLYFVEPDGGGYWCLGTPEPVQTSAAIARDGTIYFGCDDGNLYAVAPDGAVEWTYQTGGPVTASPAIADDGTVWFGTADDRLLGLNPDGAVLHDLSSAYSPVCSPAISNDGKVFLSLGDWLDEYYVFDGTEIHTGDLDLNFVSLVQLEVYKQLEDSEDWDFTTTEAWTIQNNYSAVIKDVASDNYETYNYFLFHLERSAYRAYYSLFQGPGTTFFFLNEDRRLEKYSLAGNEYNQPELHWTSENPMYMASVDGTGACYGRFDEHLNAFNTDGTLRWQLQGSFRGATVIGPDNNLLVRTSDGGLVSIGGDLDGTLPEAVTAPSAIYNDYYNTIYLRWDPANGAEHYEVYRDDLVEPLQVKDVVDVSDNGYYSIADDTVLPGLPYYYKVRAVNSVGPGGFSPSVPGPARVPAPESLTASQGTSADTITLEWSAVELATGYRVYCDVYDEDSAPLAELAASSTTWDHTTRTDWDEHTYFVTAFNNYSVSLASEATGWLIRGTGDTGPGDWVTYEHDSGRSNRSNITGPATSNIAWEFQPDQRFINGSASFNTLRTGEQGSLYCQCYQHPYSIFGLDSSGELRWTYETSTSLFTIFADGTLGLSGSPMGLLASNGVYTGDLELSSGGLILLPGGEYLTNLSTQLTRYNSDGSVAWQLPIADPYTGSGAAVAPDGSIYQILRAPEETTKQGPGDPDPWGGYQTYVYSIHAVNPDGTERWLRENTGSHDLLAIDGPAVFLSTDESTLALDTTDGATRWSFPVTGLLAADHLGRLVLATEYSLVVFDGEGGVAWEYVFPDGFTCDDAAVVDLASKVYLTIHDGDSHLIRYLCFDSAGTQLWSHELEQAAVPGPMVINQDGSLVCPYTRYEVDDRRASLIAFGE